MAQRTARRPQWRQRTMKDSSPVKMVPTLHSGFQVSGWKSLMDRQSRVLVWNRPFGVIMYTAGGCRRSRERGGVHVRARSRRRTFIGYCEGNTSLPQ